MLANLTLADLQLQIGVTLIVIVVVAAVSFVLGRLSMAPVVLTDEQQAEIDRMETTIRGDTEHRKAQMTPFRGQIACDILPLPEPPEMSLGEILEVAGNPSIDRIVGATNRHVAAAPRKTPAIDDQPSTINELYTEHSPQIPELRKPSGVYEDDWRGGEYGGSVEMLRRVSEREVED